MWRKELFWVVAVVALVAAILVAVRLRSDDGSVSSADAGPFATIVFSRTEITQADDCVPNDTGVARLDTVVAPYLKSLGMTATGSLQTDAVEQSNEVCTHYDSSMMASWDQAKSLATTYGWSFISHTATYPPTPHLSPAQSKAETCGSAATIDNHGLPGAHGMISYPGDWPTPTFLQTKFGSACFAWGRSYGDGGITTPASATTPPYWQHTMGAEGGPCNDSSQSCFRLAMVSGSSPYTLPSALISDVKHVGRGKWFTLQQFILVEGKSPKYGTSRVAWDCTSSNPVLHWTNDNERYCYNDWQTVIRALASVHGLKVTDPLTVGKAFGRPAVYPTSGPG